MKNSDMPASPTVIAPSQNGLDPVVHDGENYFATGLTKREAFAMAAMQGMLSNSVTITAPHDECLEYVKQRAYFQADLMLEEGDK